jgi:hypothetical protein
MDLYFQILLFVIFGVVLLWFGYNIFGQLAGGIHLSRQSEPRQRYYKSTVVSSGEPQICPVCSARLNKGELVKSLTFPSPAGSTTRIMHIRGCVYCLEGGRLRRCPVCGVSLEDNEILIARMFDRRYRRTHVHVLGCSRCRKAGTSTRPAPARSPAGS